MVDSEISFAMSDTELQGLDALLAVLRKHGVTHAKFGAVELAVALPDVASPVTFHDIDAAESSRPYRPSSPADVRFPGSK